MKINEIVQINNQLQLMIENEELDEETIKDTQELIRIEIENNSNGLVAYYNDLNGEIEKNKNMANLYTERAEALKKRKEWLKKSITYFMKVTNTTQIKTDFAKISFRKSKATDIYDPKLLPEDCFIIKKEPSKSKVKEKLDKGEEVQGARIIENENLQIR